MGSFLFRWPRLADHVYVTGTFDDWAGNIRLSKVGNGFEKRIHLNESDFKHGKIEYKFVVDDAWIVDDDAPKEDDGHFNINNVLYLSQLQEYTPDAPASAAKDTATTEPQSPGAAHRIVATSSAPPGSHPTEGALTEAPIVSAGGEGAPLLSIEQSKANLARWVPHIMPNPDRPVTRSLAEAGGSTAATAEEKDSSIPGAFPGESANEPDSFSVNPIPATGQKDIQSSVTTSKEDFDNAGGEGTAGGAVSILPVLAPGTKSLGDTATTSKEDYDKVGGDDDQQVGVSPLPATGHKDIESSVTTSKEDFEKAGGEGTAIGVGPADDQQVSVNPLPADGHKDIQSSVTTSKEDFEKAGGEGTAIGVGPADDQQVSVNPLPADGHKDIQSSVTTSKEDYEKAGAFGTAGLMVAGAGAAIASAFSKPKDTDKNIIPESSLPMNPEQLDTMDRGPFINSAGPGTTTADLASKVPLEPKREAQVIDSSGPEAPEPSKEAGAAPFISSSGPGTTTGDLASKVPLEPKRDAKVVDPSGPEAPEPLKETSATPFISSSGPGTTTGDLASKVPLEPKREPQVIDSTPPTTSEEASAAPIISSVGAGATTAALASQVPLEPKRDAEVIDPSGTSRESGISPFINSSGPGTTTAGLAAQVPVEQKRQGVVVDDEPASPEVVAEKAALDKELLQKVPTSEAKGQPASAAAAQSSYYGLATAVPEPVEESMVKAQASPEAATESSAVAEKSAVERELHAKVPVDESAGEPAPAYSAAQVTTAPAATVAAASVTDGKTANEAVPGTDTGSQTQGATAGEIAAGAAVGGAAAAGATALAAKHNDETAEPPRVADSTKPTVNTEVAPATQLTSSVTSPGGFGTASTHPGVSPSAVMALSDGTEDPTIADEPTATKSKAPVETSEATATEYAPPRAKGLAPGVSPSAAAAFSDGTEDPTLDEDEKPAAEESKATTTTPAAAVAKQEPGKSVEEGQKSVSSAARDPSPMSRPGEASAAGQHAKAETPKKTTTGAVGSSSSTPAKSTPESSTTGEKRKKRHRLSAIIKKIFD